LGLLIAERVYRAVAAAAVTDDETPLDPRSR
jgi:hypothetical protein